MNENNTKTTFSKAVRVIGLLLVTLAVAACNTMPKSDAPMAEETSGSKSGEATASTPAAEAAPSAPADMTAAPAEAAASAEPVAEPTPPVIVASCKDEPYVNYEKQARESIAKGLAATEAGTYGVGFRDRDEHKKWTAIHNQLFEKVNTSCQTLSDCGKQNPNDKETKCAEQAKTFAGWQALAGQFAEKAKQVETTQPPLICSFEPNLNDPTHCFHDLAANVDKACDSADCKELSACWNGVGYLETAIAQAERACGFVHESLDKCRGYIEAKSRREKKFDQCKSMQGKSMQGKLTVEVIPAL